MRSPEALPPAIESAQLMSGATYKLGEFTCPLVYTPSPLVRAHSLAALVRDSVIICGMSAAWVWGADRELRKPLEFAVPATKRVRVGCAVPHWRREYQFTDTEVTQMRGTHVTTPARTAFDILRSSARFDIRERVACRILLFNINTEGRVEVENMVRSRNRMPNTALVRERLARLYDVS